MKSKKKALLPVVVFVTLMLVASIFSGCGGQTAPKTPAAPSTPAAPAPAPGKTFEFSLAHMWPAGHPHEVEFAQPWAAELFEKSGGRIKIVSYPGGTLLSGPETYEGVVQGVADLGMGVYAYTRGRFPFIEAFLLPGLNVTTAKGSSLAVMEGIAKFDPAELHDVYHLFTFAAGEGYLMSKKLIKSLEDIQGMQIGGTAGPRAEAIRALGATEVILPMPEWYEALDRGIMEAGICPLEALQGFRLGEVTADYILATPMLYNQLFFFVMNKDAWDSMDADLQKIFTEVTDKYYNEMMAGLFDDLGQRALKFTAEVKGKDPIITYMDAAEQQRWTDRIKPILDKYADELTAKGLPGREIVDMAVELTNKYSK